MNRFLLISALFFAAAAPAAEQRPNIVWIFGEDMGPELGCYGDTQAITPNMDKLAKQGARFTHCFTHAPVCAPSRSGLITGQYPVSIGTHHMRSKLISPPPTFTSYLRKAGYFVDWPGKTDFNFDVPKDAFDSTADWTKKLARQPFFAYVNIPDSHESSIRMMDKFEKFTARLTPAERHDPAKMRLPLYYPDAPEVRRDLANYYDLVTAVDHKVGEILRFLDEQGIADNTVVFLTGDHGRGLPRSKRWVYDVGIHVPLIVRWPGKIKPGIVRDDLVCFIDFAPTVLSLAGAPCKTGILPVPPQGDGPPNFPGIVFLGPKTQERKYIFAARDRMDETYDRIRTVRSKDYQYIRNFHAELPYAQRIAYAEEMPTLQVWRRLNGEGKLTGPQKLFFAPTKPSEELYDVKADPDEVHNLAASPAHEAVLKELRGALDKWIDETRDLGAIPEAELIKRGLVKDVSANYADRKKTDQ
jgi:N-sulfoglucosamine sulfohydrolase